MISLITLFTGDVEYFRRWNEMVKRENLDEVRFVLNIPDGSIINPNLPSEPVIFNHPLIKNASSEYKRTQHVVNVYNDILQKISDDVIFILEEDVWAEQGFLAKLLENVLNGSTPVISGVYNFRDSSPEFKPICLYNLGEDGKPIPYREDIKPSFITKCFVGSTGLMAIKRSVLQEVNYLRCQKIVFDGFPNSPSCEGWDICLGYDMLNKGIPFYVDPTIKTLHGRNR